MNHYVLMGLDVRATYEATDSDIRLISYKAGSDLGIWPTLRPTLASLLALIGESLLGRIAKSELHPDRRDVGVWAKALAEAKGNVRKAESRYIAKRVKQLKRIGSASTETASSALAAGLPPTPQTPIANVRKRILLGTVAALVVNACTNEIGNPGHTTAAEVLAWAACVPLIFAVLVWIIVSLMHGAKFKASWRVYEGALLAVTALRLLSKVIHAVQN
jgi:hypothetical protein